MSESKNKMNSDLGTDRNIPCTGGRSLLKLSPRAAKGAPGLHKVRPCSPSRASLFFGTTRDAAQAFIPSRNQLVGVWEVVTPTAATIFDPMVRQSDKQQNNLRRRFLRGNAGANTSNTNLKPKGR
jgi:hypothetical protein